MIATEPKDIHYHYYGIKYSIEDTSLFEKTEIYIDGKINNSLFGKPNEFLGKIKIGDKEFDYSAYPIKFSNENLAPLESSDHYGMISIDKGFQRLTVDIHKRVGNGSYISCGWMISAPCNKYH